MSIVFNCQSYKLVVIRLYIESRYRLEDGVYNCMNLDRQICSDYHLNLLSTLAHNLKIYNSNVKWIYHRKIYFIAFTNYFVNLLKPS